MTYPVMSLGRLFSDGLRKRLLKSVWPSAGPNRCHGALSATYPPDLNPIKKLFSKLKTVLRKAAMRSAEELWTEIGDLLNSVTTSEGANYLASSGYVCT